MKKFCKKCGKFICETTEHKKGGDKIIELLHLKRECPNNYYFTKEEVENAKRI